MGQSLVNNYIHIVFSTKNREDWINPNIEPELFAYIGGVCNELGCIVLNVGGYRNHIHILCNLSKNIALVELIKRVKGHSSKWIKSKGPIFKDFYWQRGYGAFSINSDSVESLKSYISNQKEHHRVRTFKEEYLDLLEEHKLKFDERYLWD